MENINVNNVNFKEIDKLSVNEQSKILTNPNYFELSREHNIVLH